MPRILMRLPEVARAAPDGGRDRYRIVCVFCENTREELGHPAFDGVRVAFDEGTDTEDGGVPLPQGVSVMRRLAFGEHAVLCESDETFLWCAFSYTRNGR